MNEKVTRLAIWTALGGQTLQGFGIAWAIYLYNQQHPASFSLLCNFVSELGAPHSSMMAKVFNRTLILSSPLTFPMLCALGVHIKTKLSHVALVTGFCSMLGVIGVGISPMDILKPHLIAAMMFFWGWLLTVFLFTVAFWRKYSFKASPALVLSGVLAMTACGTFLAFLMRWVASLQRAGSFNPSGLNRPGFNLQTFHRPVIWDIAILEWSVVLSIALWNLAAFYYLLRRKKTAGRA